MWIVQIVLNIYLIQLSCPLPGGWPGGGWVTYSERVQLSPAERNQQQV